jgi:threonylcarbamoyladenosine tRNA methylthiotransferase MtaB
MKTTTVAITTLGCKVNQYESAAIEEALLTRGYRVTDFSSKADVYIINTCTVTQKTDYQSRQIIRRAHKANPGGRIIVTGCYAQIAPEALAQLSGVSLVLGNAAKQQIADLIEPACGTYPARTIIPDLGADACFRDPPLHSFANHTRAFLKIQDGCESFCSYCIVPYARGRCRSLPPDEVLKHLSALSESGFREVVLSGIHLSAYGTDLTPRGSLLELLKRIDHSKPVSRVRLSSLEPMEVSPALIDLITASQTICPHLHLPLQSGNDTILSLMNRPYRAADFREIANMLHASIPDLCLGTDLIAGFPGETEARFRSTCEMLESLPISYVHVFPYSRREKTAAADLPGQVPQQAIKARSAVLRGIGIKKRRAFYSAFVGKELNVLVEGGTGGAPGQVRGRSANYIPVVFAGPPGLRNCEVTVRAVRIEGDLVRADYRDLPLNT